PALVPLALGRALRLMQQWAGGTVARDILDAYPKPHQDPVNVITPRDVRRYLGLDLDAETIAELLRRLEFEVHIEGEGDEARLIVRTPPHRLDIGEGVVGRADLMEEIARIYGYDRIPETRLADELPPQIEDPRLEAETRLVDTLVKLGLQEVITYRLTAPEREARALAPDVEPPPEHAYVRLLNPIAEDRRVLRRSLFPNLLEVAERNARFVERQAMFEVGPVFWPREGELLPEEPPFLAFLLTGPREPEYWAGSDTEAMDFYDLKGILEALARALHLQAPLHFAPGRHPSLHPGKTAAVYLGSTLLGHIGELHPQVAARYDLPYPVIGGELALAPLLDAIPERYPIEPISPYPPVVEDIAFVVDEDVPAQRVADVIREAGGARLVRVELFDVYRDAEKLGPGKKSLAYHLTYQDPNRTLTDKDAAKIRKRIIRRVEQTLGGQLRG
ncbi:MAG: phenylalanine--tRNA ligase subunit beta, partial [Chloroflexi bacterium]|nr:phenylalanine--tRNA ligase subunit beta [Chloroflexota bacterium]